MISFTMSDQSDHPAVQVIFRLHAIQRMFQRRISKVDVITVLMAGEIIENYPDDLPYPSRLIVGWAGARPLHVVAAYNASSGEEIIITVYEPEAGKWEADYKRRKP